MGHVVGAADPDFAVCRAFPLRTKGETVAGSSGSAVRVPVARGVGEWSAGDLANVGTSIAGGDGGIGGYGTSAAAPAKGGMAVISCVRGGIERKWRWWLTDDLGSCVTGDGFVLAILGGLAVSPVSN